MFSEMWKVDCVIDLLYVVLNASFVLWLEHCLNGHCGTVYPFYLLYKKSSH